MPDAGEGFQAFPQSCHALLVAHITARNFRGAGGDIRPVGELVTLLEGKVEQGCQHLGGEVDRHPFHPVKRFPHRQLVQYLDHAGANKPLHLRQVFRRHHRLRCAPLHIVLGRIHGDEHLKRDIVGQVANNDSGFRGESLVVAVHGDNVCKAGDRPERAEGAIGLVVHRVLLPQAGEERPPGVLLQQTRVTDIYLRQRNAGGIG